TGVKGSTVLVWRTEKGKIDTTNPVLEAKLDATAVLRLSWGPDGRFLALWDANKGDAVVWATKPARWGLDASPAGLAFCGDSRLAVLTGAPAPELRHREAPFAGAEARLGGPARAGGLACGGGWVAAAGQGVLRARLRT